VNLLVENNSHHLPRSELCSVFMRACRVFLFSELS
jgi:hypothetical protein